MKFIKLGGRPRKDKKLFLNSSEIGAAKMLGMVKISGYLVVDDANKAIENIVQNNLRIPAWIMSRLMEMKNDTARV